MTARLVMFMTSLIISTAATAAGLGSISDSEANSGLKQALSDGASAAVAQLGTANGFLGNPQVKIPLPPALKKVESALRFAGMKQQADDLVVAMNRAAEAAVPEAKALLIGAVQKMSVQDAKQILTGGDTAATEYFRKTTQKDLGARFLPIVKKATEKVGLAERYNALAGQGVQLGLIKSEQGTIENYVTAKALDGLYLMIGEQEKSFRRDPVGATSGIVQKVFGAIKR